MELFRLHPLDYSPLDGAGAAKRGGRWNERGVPIVYCGESRALCVLESLVHLNAHGVELPDNYALSRIHVPGWIAIEDILEPSFDAARSIGSAWARSLRSAVLRVLSALVPGEYNYLLNPRHAGFARISVAATVAFEFDARFRPAVVAPALAYAPA
jgi:RES domain-containing protein